MSRRLGTAAGVVAVAAIAAAFTYAAIPGPGDVYGACMLKGVGTIRLIDKSLPSTNLMSRCTDKELEISWNKAGQAGPKGDKGDPGRGLDSLDDLAGVPCRTPEFQGVVELSSTPLSVKSASVVVRCTIPNSAILTVELANTDPLRAGAGRVTGGPVDCELGQGLDGHSCVYAVPLESELTLTATPLSPTEGYASTFIGWLSPHNECSLRTSGPCTFTVTGDGTVVAYFSAETVSP